MPKIGIKCSKGELEDLLISNPPGPGDNLLGLNFRIDLIAKHLKIKQVYFRINSDGSIFLQEGDAETTISNTATLVLADPARDSGLIEFDFDTDPGTGAFHFSFIHKDMLDLMLINAQNIVVSPCMIKLGAMLIPEIPTLPTHDFFALKFESDREEMVMVGAEAEDAIPGTSLWIPHGTIPPPCPPWWDPIGTFMYLSNSLEQTMMTYSIQNKSNFLVKATYWLAPKSWYTRLNSLFRIQQRRHTFKALAFAQFQSAWVDFINRTQGMNIQPTGHPSGPMSGIIPGGTIQGSPGKLSKPDQLNKPDDEKKDDKVDKDPKDPKGDGGEEV